MDVFVFFDWGELNEILGYEGNWEETLGLITLLIYVSVGIREVSSDVCCSLLPGIATVRDEVPETIQEGRALAPDEISLLGHPLCLIIGYLQPLQPLQLLFSWTGLERVHGEVVVTVSTNESISIDYYYYY